MDDVWLITVFAAYFVLLIAIAITRSRQIRNMSEYVLGGRRLGNFTAALSAGSSATSAWTTLSLPGLVFVGGLGSIWIPVFAVVGAWTSWTVLAKRLRRYTIAADDALTLPEFLETRFRDRTGALRTTTSLISILFVVFYVSSGFVGGSKLLETMFGIEAATGVWLTFFVIASYTLIGGFMAVSRTDVFQALLLLVSFLVIAGTFVTRVELPITDFGGAPTSYLNPFADHGGVWASIFYYLSAAGWGLGAFGAQRVIQRYMALAREDGYKQSRNISITWLVAVFGLAVVAGLLARPALLSVGMSLELADPERIYFIVSDVFFHPLVTGVLLTAVIAAVMSTADSQLLLASGTATTDLPWIKNVAHGLTSSGRVWLGRLLLIVIGSIAAAISILYPTTIFSLVTYAWGGMGAAFGPVTLLALYWRRFNLEGAAASMVSGTGAASLWWFMRGGPSGIWDLDPATPGFLIAMLVAVGVTLLTPRPAAEVVELFDTVNGRPLS